MKNDTLPSASAGGWRVGPSIAFELDIALTAVRDYSVGSSMPPEFAEVIRMLPAEWRDEMPEVFRRLTSYSSILEKPAYLAGVLDQGDYGYATLAIRDLTVEAALERLAAGLQPLGLAPDPALPPGPALVDLGVRGERALFAQVGLDLIAGSLHEQQTRADYERALLVLRGSPHHAPFWHWVDRFYFEFYHPWRRSREEYIQSRLDEVRQHFGALEGSGPLPPLDWLPTQNPLLRLNGLQSAQQAGQFEVYFWLEPFGMADLWSIYPGRILVAFGQPGAIFENFQAFAAGLADRTKALADPTRLIILRLIRHFGMVNTEIANYLGLSRPTVSIHAKILREAGLIESEQIGREMKHRVVPGEIRRLFRDLEMFFELEYLNVPDQTSDSARTSSDLRLKK